jgi:hypothetical protein
MSYSSNQLGSTILHCELDLFYDTPVVCGCSKCKGLMKSLRRVIYFNYINDRLPKVDGLIPPTAVKSIIGDIEKKHKNTSIFSFFEKLESKSTKFHPKLAKPFPYIEPMESSSERKYNINTTQNISTKRSKKNYDLIEKMSKYTPKYF